MKKKLLAVFLFISAAVFLCTASAFAFTNVVTFGDSISDNGSLLANPSNGLAGDYWGFGTYTNGTPWADQLAAKYGASMLNVAYGGATTGLGNIYAPPVGTVPADTTGLNWQVNNAGIQSVVSYMPKDSTLFTVWAGANDYNRLMALTGNTATAAQKQAAAMTAVDNIMNALETLKTTVGAKHILVPNLMLLGDGNFTLTYNTALKARIDAFDTPADNITVYEVDMFNLYLGLFAGYDMTDPNWRLAAMADGVLWTDGYHPGSVAHAAMAEAAYQTAAPVPEPATMMLVAFGLIGIAGISRKKAA